MLSFKVIRCQCFRLIGQHSTHFVVVILKGHPSPDGAVEVPLIFMGEEAARFSVACLGFWVEMMTNSMHNWFYFWMDSPGQMFMTRM